MRLTKKHPFVNKNAFYNRTIKLKVISVILDGDVVSMIEGVDSNGKIYKDKYEEFFIEGEPFFHCNTKIYSPESRCVQKCLKDWMCQKTFWGVSWDGLEEFYRDISLVPFSSKIGIESNGWYKYPSSTKKKKDGKDWRIILLDVDPVVVINCHSIMTDSHWTLTTTVHDERDIDKSKIKNIIEDSDPMIKSMLMTIMTAELLGKDRVYNYRSAIADMKRRLKEVRKLRQMMMKMIPEVNRAYMDIFGKKSKLPDYITLGINYWGSKTGKIGRIAYPTKDIPWAEMVINPVAYTRPNVMLYLHQIVLHELIHAALGKNCCKRAHGKEFIKMSEKLNLLKKYRK